VSECHGLAEIVAIEDLLPGDKLLMHFVGKGNRTTKACGPQVKEKAR
jgi:hypothetical protein